jgi:hypothetical protein
MTPLKKDSLVSVCIVPRERFSLAEQSLENIIRATDPSVPIIYVDANAPEAIASGLSEQCARRGANYIRLGEYLAPNVARSIALEKVSTKYLVFLDNDLFVEPGWLNALIECAEQTGAWAVSPLVMEGSATLPLVHMAGGDLQTREQNGVLQLGESHRQLHRLPFLARPLLKREPCGFFEYHAVLLRRSIFDEACTIDPKLTSVHEHIDLALQIQAAGGTIYFEPGSSVRYDSATRFSDQDRAFFELRWSETWTRQTLDHFRRKWGLASNDEGLSWVENWVARHRGLYGQSSRPWPARAAWLTLRREGGAILEKLGLRRRPGAL